MSLFNTCQYIKDSYVKNAQWHTACGNKTSILRDVNMFKMSSTFNYLMSFSQKEKL